eukprot:7561358-Pyramimonas_sp.AAC.1
MAGAECAIDRCVKCVEDTFGACKVNAHACANCAVRYAEDSDGNITLYQDEYTKQLRPFQHHALAGAGAEAKASKMVADICVSLRGAFAYFLYCKYWCWYMLYRYSVSKNRSTCKCDD